MEDHTFLNKEAGIEKKKNVIGFISSFLFLPPCLGELHHMSTEKRFSNRSEKRFSNRSGNSLQNRFGKRFSNRSEKRFSNRSEKRFSNRFGNRL